MLHTENFGVHLKKNISDDVNLGQKFSPGPGFELRSSALRAGAHQTVPSRRIIGATQNYSLVDRH